MGLNSFGLDAFYACAQVKNFTKAADRLNMTQSALSQRIKSLEEELGVTLFIRERIGVRLTENGEALLHYCQTRKQLEEELITQISTNPKDLSGSLRIAAYSSVMRSIVMSACHLIHNKYPKIQLQLLSRELFEIPDLLKNSTVDFIILDYKLEKEGIASHLLGYEQNVRIRKKSSLFNGYYLDHDENDETTLRYLKLKSGAKIKRHFMDDIYGIIDGVQAGIGDAIAPRHLLDGISNIEIIDKHIQLKNPVYLHYYQLPIKSKIFEIFIDSVIKSSKDFLD